MTDATRDKLKAIRKTKPLQTAILTTLEYDSGFAQGEKAGYNQAIDEAIEIVRAVDPAFMIQELEALKTEIKK